MKQTSDARRPVNFAWDTLKLYWQHIRGNKTNFLIIMLFVPLSALLISTLVPYYLSQSIAHLASGSGDVVSPLVLAAIYGSVGSIINYVGFRLMTHHEAYMYTSILNGTAKTLIEKDYSFFSNQKIGALTTKLIEFTNSYMKLQDLFVIRTLSFAISMGLGLFLVSKSSPLLALLLLLLITVILVQIRITMKIRTPYRVVRKDLRAKIIGEIADALTNNIVVKTFANEKYELANTRKRTDAHQKIFIKDISIVTSEGSLRNFITVVFQVITVLTAITLMKQGRADLGTAIFALTYLQRIAAQVFTLGEMVNGYDNAFLEAAPMTQMLLSKNRIHDADNAKKLNIQNASITFSNVNYRYEDNNEAIKKFSLDIKAGEKIGLVGHSGAGKTTVTKLLLRFDDINEGSITIDGQDIQVITQESLRKNIAYVPQEPMLFHRSLAENIGYAKQNVTKEEIAAAAKLAHAHEFITNLPKGYKTLVGERGVKLSGGQRQRIAIARAILKDAPILLLDEATSALDSESEHLIQKALWKLMEGRTAIVIAHRLSTIQKMDRIVVMESGRIIEQGSHSELLTEGGRYAKLWQHQSGGFLED